MNQILTEKVTLSSLKANVPDLKVGHTVRVYQKISEGDKDRVQIFEGLIIKVNSGHGINKSFTVRKIVSGIGVEKIFPLHSSSISKIELVKRAKVRSGKLFHMRDLTGKNARLREKYYGENDEVAVDATSKAKAKALGAEPEILESKEEEKNDAVAT